MADQSRNPKDETSTLFKRLTRIFSGPINTRRAQTYTRLKRTRMNMFATRFKSLSGQTFKKQGYNPFTSLQSERIAQHNRAERYREFDQMHFYPELAASLDIYADEMTTSTPMSPVLRIDCQNEEIKDVLITLYYDILNVEQNLFYWCRSMCQYGDFFAYIDVDESEGVSSVLPLPKEEVERLEGEDETNPNYVQFQWNTAGITFESWQVMHLRNLGIDRYAPYGMSVLEHGRRIWRQLLLLEDSVMAYRIVRSPERRVFYIDVGAIPANEVEGYMEEVVTSMKRHQIVDDDTGRVDLRYNPMSVDEDYYVPVRGNSSTKIETLAGGQYTGDIEDLKYLQQKLFAAIKVPMSYLIRDENSSEDQETLAQKDIRFSRTILRLQKPVISELEKIGILHLYILGFSEEDAASFTLSLNNPSKIAELQELETLRTKTDAASSLGEFFSRRWVYHKVFDISDQEITRIERERKGDAQLEAELQQMAAPEDGMGDLGGAGDLGDLGGADDLDSVDLGPDSDLELDDGLGGGDAGLDNNEPEDDGGLLVAPGNRDDGNPTKDWWKATTDDKRDMGARKRSMKSAYSHEKSRNTYRTTFKGLPGLKKKTREVMREISEELGENEDVDESYEMEKLLERSKDTLKKINQFKNTNTIFVNKDDEDEI